ncbi:MAG: hypothetical protein R3A48_18100 [Polyangiales bacterium]
MLYEIYHRICVGLPVEPDAAQAVVARFHARLGLEPSASASEVYARLSEGVPRHKLNDPDRQRYELALEAFVDEVWSVDCAIGGVSDGIFDPTRCFLFVGVRVEQFERVVRDEQPAAASRPQWLRKGDLSPGSEFLRGLGPEAKKPVEHAGRMHHRARLMIEGDARTRLKSLPVSRQREPGWAQLRWLVPSR